jgi:hypothetical protein
MKMKCWNCGFEWTNSLKVAIGSLKGEVSHGLCKKCEPILNKRLDQIIKENNKRISNGTI